MTKEHYKCLPNLTQPNIEAILGIIQKYIEHCNNEKYLKN